MSHSRLQIKLLANSNNGGGLRSEIKGRINVSMEIWVGGDQGAWQGPGRRPEGGSRPQLKRSWVWPVGDLQEHQELLEEYGEGFAGIAVGTNTGQGAGNLGRDTAIGQRRSQASNPWPPGPEPALRSSHGAEKGASRSCWKQRGSCGLAVWGKGLLGQGVVQTVQSGAWREVRGLEP